MSANWIDRGLLPALRRSATDGLPVTVLVGPRSCGKTTLAARLVKEGVYRRYVSFADPGVRSAAAASPQLFVDSLPFGTVIDEAQLVPEVLVPVKSAVDAAGMPGHFLLTGSTRVDLPTMGGSHPLAGRMARFELGPLTAAERHGFPLLVTTRADRGRWRRDYLRSVVPETLSESDHAIDHSRLTRLLDGIAGIAGHELVISRLVADLAIDRRTASRYLDLLEEMRLIRRLPGLRSKATDTERAVPKLHMADPVLVARDPAGVSDDRRGALLESFVVNEIASQLEWEGGNDGLYHWRDRRRDEVDLVVESDHTYTAIEVKRAREVPTDATSGIEAFRARYPGRFRRGLVMYAGPHVLPLGDAIWAVPISALWA